MSKCAVLSGTTHQQIEKLVLIKRIGRDGVNRLESSKAIDRSNREIIGVRIFLQKDLKP
ncbi:MAG: hypothetical protein QNJ32_13200 [Xenococcaceae cyanobacterium MO_167.B27]|nr:hypothetical protein [Xenococcaceae cyanobacterium MO_167.B27]